MELSALRQYAAHVLEACAHVQRDPHSEMHRSALLSTLARIHHIRPQGASAFVVGLFNQSLAHTEEAAFRVKEARRCPSAETSQALRRAALLLQEHVAKLAATRIVKENERQDAHF